jgi:hypothetical protein
MIARIRDGQRVIHRAPSLEPPMAPDDRQRSVWPAILLHCFGVMLASMFGAALVIAFAMLAIAGRAT